MEATGLDDYDDVASLFHRLGSKDEFIAYKDFSASQKVVAAKVGISEKPVASQRGVATAPAAARNAADVVFPATILAPSLPAEVERSVTPLQQMFQRLASGQVRNSEHSPLSKLQVR